MLRLVFVLIGSGLLYSSCVPHAAVIPDPTVPHQVAEEAVVKVWVDTTQGVKVKQEVRLLPGWWIAGPPVVEPLP